MAMPMRRPPTPAMDAGAPAPASPAPDAMDMAEEETAEPVVVATILKHPDGSFELREGEPPEPMGEMGEMEGMEGAGGMAPMMAEPAPSITVDFERRGELLNRINEIMEADSDGGSPRQKAFQAGYNGDAEAA